MSNEIQYYLWTIILAIGVICVDLVRKLYIIKFKSVFSMFEHGLFVLIPAFLVGYLRISLGLGKRSLLISIIIYIVIGLLYAFLFSRFFK